VLSERDQLLVIKRAEGATVGQLGEQFGISHQRASAVVKDARRFVDQCELDLLAATKTDEVCAYVIPYGENYTVAMQFSDWLIGELRDRGVDLTVETRRAHNGIALVLRDVTDYGGAR
jgi:hypothetical protein